MLPNEQLQTSAAPFADAARIAFGAAERRYRVCAAVTRILGGWMLLVGQSAKAAADDGMFPRIFARLNCHGVPASGC
jgi:arginine:agmatine antiporter